MSGARQRAELFFALAGFIMLLAVCATPPDQTPVDELRELGPNEGIVIGSVLIEIEKPEDDSWLAGGKIGEHNWSLVITADRDQPILTEFFLLGLASFRIGARLGEPVLILRKLPAGQYHFDGVSQEGPNRSYYVNLHLPFVVDPGQTIYVGRVIINPPARIWFRGQASIRVVDEREATLEWARQNYGYDAKGVVTDLMGDGGEHPYEYPQIFEKVYYRTRLSPSGPLTNIRMKLLTVERDGVKLESKDPTIEIPFSEFISVDYGTIGSNRSKWWITIEYGDATSPDYAVITDGQRPGWPGSTGEIFALIRHAIEASDLGHIEVKQ